VCPNPEQQVLSEEQELLADTRLGEAIFLFNSGDWYACHDGFEALWHETAGPMRPVLQGILQIAVAELHLERGNCRGATILMGEGLGRLKACPPNALGIDLGILINLSMQRLLALQQQDSTEGFELPRLVETSTLNRSVD
jgi:predicted metal-dependent hydrolase